MSYEHGEGTGGGHGSYSGQISLRCKEQNPISEQLKQKGDLLAHLTGKSRRICFRDSWIQKLCDDVIWALPVCGFLLHGGALPR